MTTLSYILIQITVCLFQFLYNSSISIYIPWPFSPLNGGWPRRNELQKEEKKDTYAKNTKLKGSSFVSNKQNKCSKLKLN